VRAALLLGPGRLEMGDVERPDVAEGEALVGIHTVGVCGTDQKIYAGAIPVSYPRIMGHEIAGEVLAAAGGLAAGARVIVDPSIACGRCARCREGRGNICADGWLLGRDRDGGMRESMSAPLANLHQLPSGVTDDVAPLIQVLTTCVHGQRMVDLFPGESVVIVGLGVMGLLHLQLAKLRGAWPVVCVTRSERKVELARALGADVTVRSSDGAVEEIHDVTDGGADVTIECAGQVATLARSVAIARPGGRILAHGTIAESEGPFPFYDLYYKELAITNARAARPEDFPVAIGSVASGGVRLDPLITHRFPLSDAVSAFRAGEMSDALKVVVDVGGGAG
jgi:L-iditol 2-dehydrogenase